MQDGMNICEAVRRAQKENKKICRQSAAFHGGIMRIKPTNSYGACIAITCDETGNEIHRCKNWNPTAEDLMAEDWILVE